MIEILRQSDMHAVDQHPSVHSVPSPMKHSQFELSSGLTTANIAHHHQTSNRPSSRMASPFTPRTPSRLRISANSPLRLSRKSSSRSSQRSTSSLSPKSDSSTSPLSRAGTNSFESPENHLLSKTDRKLAYSPPSSAEDQMKSRSSLFSPTSSTLSKLSNMSPSDPLSTNPLGSGTILANEQHYHNTTPLSNCSGSPSSPSYNTSPLTNNSIKKQQSIERYIIRKQQQQPTQQPTTATATIATKMDGTAAHSSKPILMKKNKIQPMISFPTASKSAAAVATVDSTVQWNQSTVPLAPNEKKIEWHFDESTGKPKIISKALIDRSSYMVLLFNHYNLKCQELIQQQQNILKVMTEGAKKVDRKKAAVVAANMKDHNVERNQMINDVNDDINDDLKVLANLENERKSLESVCRQQEILIHELTYS
jgi:hypothetical protein